ncbi:MAG: AAA family ATPase [Nitrospiraceae bacterium]
MNSSLNAIPAASIPPVPLVWLWRDRFPQGKLAVIAGDPGLGKSLLTIDLAARISAGLPFGDEQPSVAGNVVLIGAEDDAADTTVPRLIEAGADMNCVYVERGLTISDRKGRTKNAPFVDLADVAPIEKTLTAIGDVRLLVIDPISAYFGATDSYNTSEVRALLSPLAAMAQKLDVTVLLVAHLTKMNSGSALYRVGGAVGLTALARVAHCVTRDPQDESRRLFLALKNNLGPDRGGLAYRVVAPRGVPRIEWETGTVHVRADDVLQQSSSSGGGSAIDEAMAFLRETLANGPVPALEVYRQASALGVSKPTLRRAKDALKVLAEKSFGTGEWRWILPIPKDHGAHGDHDDHGEHHRDAVAEQDAQGAQGDQEITPEAVSTLPPQPQGAHAEPGENHDHLERVEHVVTKALTPKRPPKKGEPK